jgi:hypothetical protein
VEALQETISDMKAGMSARDMARPQKNSISSPAIRDGIATTKAILEAAYRQGRGTTVYQKEDRPVAIWSGRDTLAIPDPDFWFQSVTTRAQRQGVSLLEYLQDVTVDVAKLWVNNLLRQQNAYLLQSSLIERGVICRGLDGVYNNNGVPVTLLDEVSDSFVITDFSKTFLLNRQDKAEKARLALFRGSCTQGASDSVNEYLLVFNTACWEAKFDPKQNEFFTISLIHMGLLPSLKKFGFNDKFTQRAFLSVDKYVEFLLGKECEQVQFSSLPQTSATFPVTPRPYFPPTTRVNVVTETGVGDGGEGAHNLWDVTDSEEEVEVGDDGTQVCAVRSGGKPRARQSGPSGGQVRGRSGPSVHFAGATVMVPGRNGESRAMPLDDLKVDLKFTTPDAVWPVDFVMSPAHVFPDLKLSLPDRLVKTVSVMNPSLSPSLILDKYSRLKGPDVLYSWKWCLIHGCTAHGTWECPCINQICPRKGGNRG